MSNKLQASDLLRVNIVGVSGSGKSWLSKRLADQLGTPRIELDQLFWRPNWTESEIPAFRDKVEAAVQPKRWVLDGNYHSKTKDIKWRNVTMVVWVDNSFARTFSQAFVRAVKRIWHKEEIWPGTNNRETFRMTFLSKDSILLWTLFNFHGIRRRYAAIQSDQKDRNFEFVRLSGRGEVKDFLSTVADIQHSLDNSHSRLVP